MAALIGDGAAIFKPTERVKMNRMYEIAIHSAALNLVKFAESQAKPVAVKIESYANYVIGGTEHNHSQNLNDWLKRDDSVEPSLAIASELLDAQDKRKDAQELIAKFVEIFRECLTLTEIQEFGDYGFVEYGQASEQFESKLSGTVYILLKLPNADDCAILDL